MAAEEDRKKVTILTGAYRIKGYIHLFPNSRVTDYMNESKDFIAVTGAEVWEVEGRQVLAMPFINVNRNQIQIVTPED
jgi:hypothetical protein